MRYRRRRDKRVGEVPFPLRNIGSGEGWTLSFPVAGAVGSNDLSVGRNRASSHQPRRLTSDVADKPRVGLETTSGSICRGANTAGEGRVNKSSRGDSEAI